MHKFLKYNSDYDNVYCVSVIMSISSATVSYLLVPTHNNVDDIVFRFQTMGRQAELITCVVPFVSQTSGFNNAETLSYIKELKSVHGKDQKGMPRKLGDDNYSKALKKIFNIPDL